MITRSPNKKQPSASKASLELSSSRANDLFSKGIGGRFTIIPSCCQGNRKGFDSLPDRLVFVGSSTVQLRLMLSITMDCSLPGTPTGLILFFYQYVRMVEISSLVSGGAADGNFNTPNSPLFCVYVLHRR